MRKLNSRERLIVAFMIASFALLAADRWVWSPISQAYENLDDAIQAKQSELRDDQRLLTGSEQIKKDYAAYAPRREGQENRSNEMTDLLKEIEALAKRSGVKIIDVKPQTVPGHRMSSAVYLVTEGRWDPLVHFVYEVQRSPRLLQIQRAGVQAKGDDGSLVTAQFTIAQTQDKISS